ncbi:hypothetical protein [Shewanella litorisediminis]|uniref:Orphan protein n=1 Tax=Shewanella litorisediminis TaxID=1173586 RepID=A0ABX7G3T3_9GAMM|nr:hypothetical protein [Shewanella litorisediminis]MCL2919388.1 hypothetical protein [Shewanella litorisediminis]QRH01997.1 hypothetical protein JQC75_00690 [Shewanella litorisediminis]
MKKIIVLTLLIILQGCGGSNSDGSSKSTYSSCKITKSEAILATDREKDLRQCWNAPGQGYESQGDALQWCERQVNNYISSNYIVGHSVTYAVESTYCPK